MPTLIDPPVGPFSDVEEIRTWVDRLQNEPETDQEAVSVAVSQANYWLSLAETREQKNEQALTVARWVLRDGGGNPWHDPADGRFTFAELSHVEWEKTNAFLPQGPPKVTLDQYCPKCRENVEAIQAYTSTDAYKDINRALRRRQPNDDDPVITKQIEGLDFAIASTPETTEDVVLYRGVNAGKFGLNTADDFIGQTIEDRGFSSTSKSPLAALNYGSGSSVVSFETQPTKVVLAIHVPKGSHVLDVHRTRITDYHEEREVLLPRGGMFRIVQRGTIVEHYGPEGQNLSLPIPVLHVLYKPQRETARAYVRDGGGNPWHDPADGRFTSGPGGTATDELSPVEPPGGEIPNNDASKYENGGKTDLKIDEKYCPDCRPHYGAVVEYVGNGHLPINQLLRTGKIENLWMQGSENTVQQHIAGLDAAISSTPPTPDDQVVYRGVNIKRFSVDDLKIGKTILDKGFASTSKDEKTAANAFGHVIGIGLATPGTVFRITVPKGSQVLDVRKATPRAGLTWTKTEQEVLLPRESAYRITGETETKVEGKRYRVFEMRYEPAKQTLANLSTRAIDGSAAEVLLPLSQEGNDEEVDDTDDRELSRFADWTDDNIEIIDSPVERSIGLIWSVKKLVVTKPCVGCGQRAGNPYHDPIGRFTTGPSAVSHGEDQAVAERVLANPGKMLGGSNGARVYAGTDGIRRIVKVYNDPTQANGEAMANDLYRRLGLATPASETFEYEGHTHYTAPMIPGVSAANELGNLGLTEGRAKQVLNGFAADVLMANWDTAGLTFDNLMDVDGTIYRIDNGSAFLHRAMGDRKPEGALDKVTEWTGFAPGLENKNRNYAKIFQKAGISRAEDIPTIRDQWAKIKKVEQDIGGWDHYVEKTVPHMERGDRERIKQMLKARSAQLDTLINGSTRGNPYHDDATGQFTTGPSGSDSGGSDVAPDSSEKKVVLRDYLGGGYMTLNQSLRGERPQSYDDEIASANSTSPLHLRSLMDDAIASTPVTTAPMTLWRGGGSAPSVGSVVSDPAFVSTSHEEFQAVRFAKDRGGVLYEITAPAGIHALDVNTAFGKSSMWSNEREVILPRDSKFRIISVVHLTEDGETKMEFGPGDVTSMRIPKGMIRVKMELLR